MSDLSKKQQEILDYVVAQQAVKGYPPSVREICAAVNLRSTSTVHGHLERLERKGFIRRDPTKPRAIEILEKSLSKRRLPPGRRSRRRRSSLSPAPSQNLSTCPLSERLRRESRSWPLRISKITFQSQFSILITARSSCSAFAVRA